MSHEIMQGFQFLYTTLAGDSTLLGYAPGGVWRGMAPPETPTPFVVMAFQAGTDVISMNGFRLMTNGVFQAKAIGPASASAAIINAASRIDALLKLTSGGVTNGLILSCYRDSPLQLDELVAGEIFLNLGGLYRMLIEQTS